MDRSWLRRALAWTLTLAGVAVQGWLLVRFAADAMTGFIRDSQTFDGRWWHKNEPLFAIAGFALMLVPTLLLALAWTRALRAPPDAPELPRDDADGDGEDEAASIDLPAFLRPKMRRVRPGVGKLAGFTMLGLFVVAAGVALGVIEAFQLYTVLRNNADNPAALQHNSTVWILRFLQWIAPAITTLGALLLGFTWGRFLPLPPAQMVVVGESPAKAPAPAGSDWQNFD